MTKPELAAAVADQTGLRRKDVAAVVDAVLDTIEKTLRKGEEVSLVGFGTFTVRERAERIGRNPRTGDRITIPAGAACAFRPGRKLREAVGAE